MTTTINGVPTALCDALPTAGMAQFATALASGFSADFLALLLGITGNSAGPQPSLIAAAGAVPHPPEATREPVSSRKHGATTAGDAALPFAFGSPALNLPPDTAARQRTPAAATVLTAEPQAPTEARPSLPRTAAPEPIGSGRPQPSLDAAAPAETPYPAAHEQPSAAPVNRAAPIQAATLLPPALPAAVMTLQTDAHKPSEEARLSGITALPAAVCTPVDTGPVPRAYTASTLHALVATVQGHVVAARAAGPIALHLDLAPPGVGPVRVQLVAHRQAVDVHVIVPSEAAQHLLAGQAAVLRERLAQAGITLGQFAVRHDASGNAPDQRDGPPLQRQATATADPKRPLPAGSSARRRTGIDLLA